MPLFFLTNCLGVLIKYFIIIFAMVKNKVGFTYIDVAVFLIITQFIATLAYFTAPKKESKKPTKAKKR